MISRKITLLVQARLKIYPAVVLVGPRQCGKTTFAASLGGLYFDLEQESERLKLDATWDEVVAGDSLVVLDEAQSYPELFPRLRGTIDRDRKRNGRFLLLGSISPALMTQVSESLAGRLSVLELTPFLHSEIQIDNRIEKLWLYGGYPDGGILLDEQFPVWQQDYLNLLAQRDLPNWGMVVRPQTTDRLFRMLAAAHGQEWNASRIGTNLGLTYHTVNRYLDYLEGAFLVRLLPAYHANIRKRLTKRAKVYWRDSGLLHSLLSLQDSDKLFGHPGVGASWEGFVINQILSELQASGRSFNAFHFRTSDQKELDLLIEIDSQLWAFEIKLTSNPSLNDLERLNKVANLIDADTRILLCQSTDAIYNNNQMICSLDEFLTSIQR